MYRIRIGDFKGASSRLGALPPSGSFIYSNEMFIERGFYRIGGTGIRIDVSIVDYSHVDFVHLFFPHLK